MRYSCSNGGGIARPMLPALSGRRVATLKSRRVFWLTRMRGELKRQALGG